MALADDVRMGLVNRFVVDVTPGDRSLGSWHRIEGLEVSWESTEYRAGDAWNHRWFFPGFTKYPNIKLTRSAVAKDTENVKKWLDEHSTGFKMWEIKIELRDPHGEPVFAWVCKNAIPARWSIGSFEAGSSRVALETLEFTHVGFLDDDKK